MCKITAALIVIMLMTSGCSWFIPAEIKREIAIIKLDVDTVLKETDGHEGMEATDKMNRALKRIQPHIENVSNYANGQPATSN